MKKINLFFCMCLFAGQAFSQVRPENPIQFLLRPATHRENLKSSENKLQAKSFYQSKADWQMIIDTTWGPGDSLNKKLAIFDTYTGELTRSFDGFNSLGIDPSEWDSIKNSYRSSIDSSTSKGAFAALMGRLAYNLRDVHIRAWDTTVIYTPWNAGIPILIIGCDQVQHFGAILSVLPDSSLLVLRTVDDHPLGLQPGDIVLGYEGVLWKDLVDELLGSGIPIGFIQRNSKSSIRYNELESAGMNWHLFETIDIVKYGSDDTIHIPVYPLQNMVAPTMWLNEQLPVPGVPFPDPLNSTQPVYYGIVEGTNIGYIYLIGETNLTNDQFYKAVTDLYKTDGLIIDLRLNFGGDPHPTKGFNLLFNSKQYTLENVHRCNQSDFSLCSANDSNYFLITGNPMSWYDRPLAVLTGPNCISGGDYTAYMLDYHPMVQFFGKSTCGGLGFWSDYNVYPIPGWLFWYTYQSAVRNSDPEIFLSRKESPVDDSVWFDVESVAAGKDAVVEKAMEWIQNVSYAHNVLANPAYVVPGTGTVTLTAKVENPNYHNLSVNALITSIDSIICDTVSLFDDGNNNDGDTGDGTWGAIWPVPDMKTIFSADVTTEDLAAGTSRSISEAVKFTTIGPVVVDEITYTKSEFLSNCEQLLSIKVDLKNNDLTATATILQVKITSLETTLVKKWTYEKIPFADIAPGEISTSSGSYNIYISEDCPANAELPFKIEIFGDLYTFWSDTFSIAVGDLAPQVTAETNTICDKKQINIDIKSVLASPQKVYYTYKSVPDNTGAVTGNTKNSTGIWEEYNINDKLDNTTDQAQRVVYTITPYILMSDNSIGCPGTPTTTDIWVEPTVVITAEDDTIQYEGQTNIDVSSIQEPTMEVYYTYASVPENTGAVIGNTSNTAGVPISLNIKDTLYNTTGQMQRVFYTITPHVLRSDGSIGCAGTPITTDIWIDTLKTNIEEISKPMVRIYPNPANDIINIEINNTGEQHIVIELLTVSGQVIFRKEYKNSDSPFIKQIDLSGYAKGVYFVRIRQEGAVYNGKIIVQ